MFTWVNVGVRPHPTRRKGSYLPTIRDQEAVMKPYGCTLPREGEEPKPGKFGSTFAKTPANGFRQHPLRFITLEPHAVSTLVLGQNALQSLNDGNG